MDFFDISHILMSVRYISGVSSTPSANFIIFNRYSLNLDGSTNQFSSIYVDSRTCLLISSYEVGIKWECSNITLAVRDPMLESPFFGGGGIEPNR